MIGASDRKRAVRLIKETTRAGARTISACREMGISMRTFQRWTQEGNVRTDGRPSADRPAPDNKLTPQERQAVRKDDTCKEVTSPYSPTRPRIWLTLAVRWPINSLRTR